MCTPFDRWAFEMLRDFGVKHWKIPSGELTNDAYLRAIPPQAEFYCVSTGMATEEEVGHALTVLPNPAEKLICLLYCVSGYPTPANELALQTITDWVFSYPQYTIGFSDHSGWWLEGAANIAVACGAEVVERHFMLDSPLTENKAENPDWEVSAGGPELGYYIESIRETEKMLECTPRKKIQPCERATLKARNRFR